MNDLELKIERKLKNAVEQLNGKCYKWICPQVSGVPDRIVLLNGKVYFVELKRNPDSKIAALQLNIGKWLADNGFDYSILMSKYDIEYFIDRLIKEANFI